MMQQEFARMATKEDLVNVERHLDERVTSEAQEINERTGRRFESFEIKLSSYASGWSRSFDVLQERVKELDQRLTALEGKRPSK